MDKQIEEEIYNFITPNYQQIYGTIIKIHRYVGLDFYLSSNLQLMIDNLGIDFLIYISQYYPKLSYILNISEEDQQICIDYYKRHDNNEIIQNFQCDIENQKKFINTIQTIEQQIPQFKKIQSLQLTSPYEKIVQKILLKRNFILGDVNLYSPTILNDKDYDRFLKGISEASSQQSPYKQCSNYQRNSNVSSSRDMKRKFINVVQEVYKATVKDELEQIKNRSTSIDIQNYDNNKQNISYERVSFDEEYNKYSYYDSFSFPVSTPYQNSSNDNVSVSKMSNETLNDENILDEYIQSVNGSGSKFSEQIIIQNVQQNKGKYFYFVSKSFFKLFGILSFQETRLIKFIKFFPFFLHLLFSLFYIVLHFGINVQTDHFKDYIRFYDLVSTFSYIFVFLCYMIQGGTARIRYLTRLGHVLLELRKDFYTKHDTQKLWLLFGFVTYIIKFVILILLAIDEVKYENNISENGLQTYTRENKHLFYIFSQKKYDIIFDRSISCIIIFNYTLIKVTLWCFFKTLLEQYLYNYRDIHKKFLNGKRYLEELYRSFLFIEIINDFVTNIITVIVGTETVKILASLYILRQMLYDEEQYSTNQYTYLIFRLIISFVTNIILMYYAVFVNFTLDNTFQDAISLNKSYKNFTVSEKLDIQQFFWHGQKYGLKIARFKITKEILQGYIATLFSYAILAFTIK